MAPEIPISDLQQLMGHENIATTMIYVHSNPKVVLERQKKKALGDKLNIKLR